MKSFKKKIGAERTLLMVPLNIVMTGRVRGSVTPKQLSRALEKLRTRHAQLAVRVVLDDGAGWYVSDDVPEIPVTVVERKGDETWQAQAQREYRTPFSLKTGPLIRCALVRSDDRCEILLIGHHAICDGTSLTYLLRDVLDAVARPDAPIEALSAPPPIDASTVPNPLRPSAVVKWILSLMNRKWAAKKIAFDDVDMRRMHEAFWEKHREVKTAALGLDETDTAALASRCREEGVTVNTALWTAFLFAQKDVQTDSSSYRQRAALAVSTRDKLNVPVGEALGFYASSLSATLPDVSKQRFWDAARAVRKTLKKSIERTDLFRMLIADSVHPTLLDALYFQKYGLLNEPLAKKFLKKMQWHKVSYGYALTNVGRVDIPTEYDSLKLEAVFGPSFYSDVDEKVVGAVTVGGRLTLTLSCNASLVGEGTERRLMDAAAGCLMRALGKSE